MEKDIGSPPALTKTILFSFCCCIVLASAAVVWGMNVLLTSRARAAALVTSARPLRRSLSLVGDKHETWRNENDTDNMPFVKRRDGTIGEIDKTRGFVDYSRNPDPYRDPLERVFDWREINSEGHDNVERTVQAARCMDCGTPFCQTHTGCPISNLIPEWNELVYRGQWREAIDRLHKVSPG